MRICFFLMDCGVPWYAAAASKMVASVRRVMPEASITMLTDPRTAAVPGVDEVLRTTEPVAPDTLMQVKGVFWSLVGKDSAEPTIFCDVDMEFRRDFAPAFDGEWDVALMRRDAAFAAPQPYIGAMVLSAGTAGSRQWWSLYHDVVSRVPKVLSRWWGDQIALGLTVGVTHPVGGGVHCNDAWVAIKNAKDFCADPDDAGPDAYAAHWKGRQVEKGLRRA